MTSARRTRSRKSSEWKRCGCNRASRGHVGDTRGPDDFKSLEHGFDRLTHLETFAARLSGKALPVCSHPPAAGSVPFALIPGGEVSSTSIKGFTVTSVVRQMHAGRAAPSTTTTKSPACGTGSPPVA